MNAGLFFHRKSRRAAMLGALLLAASAAHAQIFKWTDERGVVHFSDTPPPPSAKVNVEVRHFAADGSPSANLPFELAQAVRNYPVTIYTGTACAVCDQGRALLRARGIPFSEKTVFSNADIEALKQAGSNGQVPFLLVGNTRLVGFDAASWNDALSNASYPAQSMLPATYQNAAAEPAAPNTPSPADLARVAAEEAAKAARAAREAAAAAQAETASPPPPNFQF